MRRSVAVTLLLSATFAAAADTPESLIDGGHFRRLQAVAESRLRANPADAKACYYLALVKLSFGDAAGAQQLAERAVKADPQVSDYHRVMSEAAGMQAEHASFFKQMSLARLIKKEADQAVALDPKNVDALLIEMGYYREAPAIVGGDKAKAEQIVRDINQIDPVRGALLRLEGRGRAGDDAKTGALLEQLAAAHPSSYLAQKSLGTWYLNHKRLDEAERVGREMLKLDPGRHNAYGLLAGVEARRGQWSGVDHWLQESDRSLPDNRTAYVTVARVLLIDKTELPRAAQYLQKYLSQPAEGGAPTHAYAHWQLALVDEQRGDKSGAVRELQTAVKMDARLGGARRDLDRLTHQ